MQRLLKFSQTSTNGHLTIRSLFFSDAVDVFALVPIGSFSNGNGDDNENGKKAICVIIKKTTLDAHHTFLYISLPSLHNHDMKVPSFTFYGGLKKVKINFSFSFLS